jgi:hypothetical protein
VQTRSPAGSVAREAIHRDGDRVRRTGLACLYPDPSRYATYNDSSGSVDKVTGQVISGSTGSYSFASYGVWETMLNNNQNLI